MKTLSLVSLLFACSCTMGLGGQKMLRDISQPAEYPAASYKSDVYVDSRGCLYMRAGNSNVTRWVPRVGRDRKASCVYEPSLAKAQ